MPVHAPRLAADLTPLPSRYVVSDVSLECGTARHAKFSVLAWILLVAFSLVHPSGRHGLLETAAEKPKEKQ